MRFFQSTFVAVFLGISLVAAGSAAQPRPSPRPSSRPSPRPSPTPKGAAARKIPPAKLAPKSVGLWTESARRLIGEPEAVRRNSIAALRRDKALTEKLKKALGTKDHFLALDVISTLEMRNMVPVILAFAERDRTGFSYHALNGLIEEKDREKVAKLYVERLGKPKTSLASKMAILDTLGRLGTDIPADLLNRLLVEDTAEVRSAALYYIRNGILLRRRQELYPFLKSALVDPTFQMRIQALYLVSEIPLEERRSRAEFFASLLESCAGDANAAVKSLCLEVAAVSRGKSG
jgi:hypothetical protein